MPDHDFKLPAQRARRGSLLWLVVVWFVAGGSATYAQFLRLGPFDFKGVVDVDAVYTTNVEGERESEATQDREDYYITYGVTFPGVAELSPFTTLDAELGVAFEKHFIRTDLDNEAAPLFQASIGSITTLRRLTLNADASYSREQENQEEGDTVRVYVPGGRKTRKISTSTSYGLGAAYQHDPFQAGYDFSADQERYDDEEFKDGESDDTSHAFDISYAFRRNWKITYSVEADRTELINDPAPEDQWNNTERIDISGDLDLWRRPKLTYSIGLEKEDDNVQEGEWEIIHTFGLSDDYEFSPALRMSYNASYELEDTPEQNDISLTYGARLEHDLSLSAVHSVSITREPVDTFGSTADTDSTSLRYAFTKADLFIYNLSLILSAGYSIDRPLDEATPEERILDYNVGLRHNRQISRRLSRSIEYVYSAEDSDQEIEVLAEHRVTLGFTYEL